MNAALWGYLLLKMFVVRGEGYSWSSDDPSLREGKYNPVERSAECMNRVRHSVAW